MSTFLLRRSLSHSSTKGITERNEVKKHHVLYRVMQPSMTIFCSPKQCSARAIFVTKLKSINQLALTLNLLEWYEAFVSILLYLSYFFKIITFDKTIRGSLNCNFTLSLKNKFENNLWRVSPHLKYIPSRTKPCTDWIHCMASSSLEYEIYLQGRKWQKEEKLRQTPIFRKEKNTI